MRIIIIGGTGEIGQAVVRELATDHELIIVGNKRGDLQVNIADTNSIEKMFKQVGKFDALIATAGKVHFAHLGDFTAEQYQMGLNNKLMGQVNLVLTGLKYINDNGSFTLTSGVLSDDPIRCGTSAAMVNGALNAFVKAAALELPRGVRINGISPTILQESLPKLYDYFKGFAPVAASKVALAYRKSVDGAQTGQIYRIL